MTTNEHYERPIYSEELFQSLYPMACQAINSITTTMPHDSFNTDRFEDYIQRCRIWTWEHCELYDPTRKNEEGKVAKFSTYMHLVFYSRLSALRNNHRNKRKNNVCVDFSNLTKLDEDFNEQNDISYVSEESTVSLECELLIKQEMVELEKTIGSDKFLVYKDFFINKYNQKELLERYPKYNPTSIRKIIKKLRKRHEATIMDIADQKHSFIAFDY